MGLVLAGAVQQALKQIEISTSGQGFTRLNDQLNGWVRSTGIQLGVLHLTCLHTSASLTINENADPRVLKDLQAWMDAVVPQDGCGPLDGQGQRTRYLHDDEGDDDMPAHIRTALTAQTMTLSVERGRLLLGTWQGIYLWEHRAIPHRRRIACHLVGWQGKTLTVKIIYWINHDYLLNACVSRVFFRWLFDPLQESHRVPHAIKLLVLF